MWSSHHLFQDMKVRMVVWMLQRHLLVQLHTYVFFVPPVPRRKKKVSEEWSIVDGSLQRSPSFSDGASGSQLLSSFEASDMLPLATLMHDIQELNSSSLRPYFVCLVAMEQ